MPKIATGETISPKLTKLCKWKYIDEVNERLDRGDSTMSVYNFIIGHGFKIGKPLVYEYAKYRKQALLEGVNVKHILKVAAKQPPKPHQVVNQEAPSNKVAKEQLSSEIDALDMVISRGYNTLASDPAVPISPTTMMTAIKLKNELTEGSHGNLTPYGLEQLKELEAAKYEALLSHVLSYVPEDQRDTVLAELDVVEDEYYRSTPYYGDYLRARGDLTEEEIARKVEIANKLIEVEIERRSA